MRISTARFVLEDDIKMIPIRKMTKNKYVATYKGKLYCPTEHCSAKLSYCSGKKGYYKTWRYNNHSPTCPYNLERDGVRYLSDKNVNLTVNISKRHKQNALERAYKSMMFDVDGQNSQRVDQPSSDIKKSSLRNSKTKVSQTAQMTLFDGGVDEELSQVKGSKLLSRFVHEISTSDIGKNRIIKGYIKDIALEDCIGEIIVTYQDKELIIVFDENFKNNPLNKSYLSKFSAIKEWMNINKTANFIGVGVVSLSKDNQFILSVSMGSDFKVDGEDLYNLERKLKIPAFI